MQRLSSRQRLYAMIAAAPRDDLEQTALRVGIVGAVLAYLCWYVMRDGTIDSSEFAVLTVTSGFFVFGIGLVVSVFASPRESRLRRFMGMIGDNAVTTYFLTQMGEDGAVILFVYLFITFGNG